MLYSQSMMSMSETQKAAEIYGASYFSPGLKCQQSTARGEVTRGICHRSALAVVHEYILSSLLPDCGLTRLRR